MNIGFTFTRLQTTKETFLEQIYKIYSYSYIYFSMEYFKTFPDFLIQLNGFYKEENAESGQRDGERRVQVREVGEGAEQDQRDGGQPGGAGESDTEENPTDRVRL